MDDRLKINIKIGDSKHPLYVKKEEEEAYRKAAVMVNERLALYADKYRNAELSEVQISQMVAFDIAVKYMKLELAGDSANASTLELESLVADLSQYLNK